MKTTLINKMSKVQQSVFKPEPFFLKKRNYSAY
jgi:hypothetical protein